MRVVLSLMAALLVLGGCGGCESSDTPKPQPSAAVQPPVPAPEGLVAEMTVPAPTQTLVKWRDAASASALFLPRTVGGVVASGFGLPLQAVEHIDDKLPIVAAMSRRGAGDAGPSTLGWAVAVHVRNTQRLLVALTSGKEPRFSSRADGELRWLTPNPALRDAYVDVRLGLLGFYLVAGGDEDAVRRLGPYLVRTMAPRQAPSEDVLIELHEAAFGGALRSQIGALRDNPLELGLSPMVSALLDVETVVESSIELLPQMSRGRVSMTFGEKTVELLAQLTPRDETTSERLAARPTLAPTLLGTLPMDTVAGLAFTEGDEGRRASATARAKSIASLVGKGWQPSDGETLGTALMEMARARGARSTFGLRCSGVGITGVAYGDVTDAEQLRKGLDTLIDFRNHTAAKTNLAAASLKLSVDETRILHVPHDVVRLRFNPTREGAEPKLEAIDLLFAVTDERYFAAAGMETVDSLQQLYASDDDKRWASSVEVATAISRLPDNAWIAALLDPKSIQACMTGRPSGDLATPMSIAVGPRDDGVQLRIEVGRHSPVFGSLIKLATERLGP